MWASVNFLSLPLNFNWKFYVEWLRSWKQFLRLIKITWKFSISVQKKNISKLLTFFFSTAKSWKIIQLFAFRLVSTFNFCFTCRFDKWKFAQKSWLRIITCFTAIMNKLLECILTFYNNAKKGGKIKFQA